MCAAPGEVDRQDAKRLHEQRQREHAGEQARRGSVAVHALVETARRALDAQPPRERDEPAEDDARAAREHQHAEPDRAERDRDLEPEVRADVVPPEGEHDAERRERQRREAAQHAFHDHRAGHGAAAVGMATGKVVDARRVAAE